ncbi:MAG: hypothetical protein H0V70_30455 [Ktedonobacteraceae bacterium]|nr:hypothetical protein [Ktedonobacteraceae bacterium]
MQQPKPQTAFERFLALSLVEQSAQKYSRGYKMCCPVHGDKRASLIFWEDEQDGHVGIRCFAGCQRADICAALGVRESDLYNGARAPQPGPTRKIDLFDLVLHKFIHPTVLFNLQVEDNVTWKTPNGQQIRGVIRLPYFLEDGTLYRRSRIRTAISAGDGSYWDGAEAPLIPYGLHKLEEARTQKLLWLVEGESDCWTHWSHGIPTLGIPGVGNTKVLEAAHLREIETLYIVQEPPTAGKKQDAGKQFVDGLCQRLRELAYPGEVYVVSLQHSLGFKDPNDLHKHLFVEGRIKEYPTELDKAVYEALPLDITAGLPHKEQLSEVQPLVEEAIGKQESNTLYALAPRVARLETRQQAVILTAMRQHMKKESGFSPRIFNKLMKEEMERQGQVQHISVTNKPDIKISGNIEEDANATLMALYSANIPPVLFVRRGKLARCRVDEEGKPLIEDLDEALLLFEMARAANFLSYNQARQAYSPTYPPVALARHILSAKSWRFPALRGITEVPVVRDDGTILDQPGYDPQAKLIYLPHPDLVIPAIPTNPTPQEVEEARNFAWKYFEEFAYETRSDGANAFGLLLTTVTRSLYGAVPMAAIDATKQGSGKGLLSKGIAYVAQGRSAAAMVPPSDENEWRKTLTSQLVEGNLLISLDNVDGLLYSSTLASFLTADVWTARLLGTMNSPEMPQRSMIMCNGNNLQLGGDIPRRSYRIRMDAGVSKPWMRNKFTYSPLIKFIRQDRGKIIASLLTMARAWIVAGRPAPATPLPALADFTGWCEVIGGILAFADVDGFLENLNQLYEETDTDGPQWAAFLEYWHATALGTKKYTAAQIVEKIKQDADFASSLPEPLAGLPLQEPKEVKAFSIKLGRALQKRKGTPYGASNYRLNKSEDTHSKQKLWSVSDAPQAQAAPARLVWGKKLPEPEPPPLEEQVTTPSEEGMLPDIADEAPASLHAEDALMHEVSDVCEAPTCQRSIEEVEDFSFDLYGNGWCEHHRNRGQVLEEGAYLSPAFPPLCCAYRQLEEGQASWEAFVKTVPDEGILAILQAIEAYKAREPEEPSS